MRQALPLLLVLAACGSSKSSRSSAAIDGTTDEGDVAPTPADDVALGAGDEVVAKSAVACACTEVVVRCRVNGDYHARADRAGCALDLPPRACAVLGLEEGTTVDPLAILGAALPDALDADDVYELCTAKHEARHTCDGGRVSACASELTAYDVTLECLGTYASDAKVAHNIEGSRAAAELNACLCNDTPCDACFAQCNADHPGFGSTCKQAREVYCH